MSQMDEATKRDCELHAEMLSVLSHPKRLMIVEILGGSEKTVGEIASELGMSLQNASQHLRIMRDRGIVMHYKEGQTVRYRLTTLTLNECCQRVRKEMIEILHNRSKLFDGASQVL